MAVNSQWYFTWISEQMSRSQGYASDAFDTAMGYLDDLNNFVTADIETTTPTINIDQPGTIAVDPTILAQMPTSPTEYPESPPAEPTFSDHDFPVEPNYSLPAVPVVNDITIPAFVSNDIVGITATLPSFTDSVPTINTITDGGDVPHDTLLQEIKAKLESIILNGGTMLNATIEDDIFDRDLERREQVLRDSLDKVTEQWAKLNWSLPDGLLAAQLTAIQTEYANKNLESSRTIAIEQAKLEQQGMLESLKLGIGVEQLILDSGNKYAQRAMDSARSTAEITIAIFKERIDKYNAMVSAYKSDAEAYKSRIDAEVARAQQYKTQIEALSLVNQIDETKTKIYVAQIDAIKSMVDIYKNQVQAVGIMYESERSKVERYKSQVEAYVAQIDAVTKKYAAEVETFKSFITGYSASADSQIKLSDLKGRAEIATTEATIKEWEIQLDIVQKNLAIKLEAIKSLATISSNVAAGALSANHSGMNAYIQGQASLSY